MAIRLRELIRAVRACKTAAEEREVIAKESAALREAFRNPDANEYRHRNVAKLMYIHMLGFPTHFGQMETLKLIASSGFAEKRIGYLGLMILLDERQEVLMLVTNSIKMDMNNTKNPYIAGLSLSALGNICSAEMARDLAPDLERLMEGGSGYIRKKAALCAIRVVKKVPDLVEQFVDRAASLVKTPDGAVQLAGVALMLQIVELDASHVEVYRQHVPALCQLLRRLLQPGGAPAEYDVSGIYNPFLQVKALRLLRHLGRGNAEASDQMSDMLAQVASNIDASRNAGNAVLYECVQTIMGVESMGGLRVLAINTLGKFLQNRDNNMRYVALNTLAKVVSVDNQAVQRHRATIVECVKDADVSIRRRALELVYGLVNEGNIQYLTRELLDYLAVSDSEFKPDLTAKICTLIQRFAPDKRWHVDNLVQLMTQAGAHVKDEVCRALIVMITNATELHGYAVRTLYRNLHAYQDVAHRSLLITALWCIGEFGEMLLPGAGGALLDGEPPLVVGEREVVDLVAACMFKKQVEAGVREVGLTAAMKLTARFPAQVPRLQVLIGKSLHSAALEAQSRSAEFTRVFTLEAGVRAQLLERMPALDETEYLSHLGIEARTGNSSAPGAIAAPATTAVVVGANGTVIASSAGAVDLLGDLGGGTQSQQAGVDALQDLLATTGAAAAQTSAATRVIMDIMDLLGDSLDPAPAPVAAPTPVAVAPQQAAPPPAEAQGPGTAAAGPVIPPAVIYTNATGLAIRFSFHKPPGQPQVTQITAMYANSGPQPIAEFAVQVAVPKFITLVLEPASGTLLPPNGAGAVAQRMTLTNTMQGTKPLAMRLRIAYTDPSSGQPVVEQTTVESLPAGL